uniref:coiled-coil and C2 domain-containing protein 2A isoform X3 n=1 Tax=Ciona intestinalis TaxID=7719 RepID=UPI0002B8DE4E|nr:coiled-coil and C2 domain-containing protein 2A isoform X3 [Ciona intestinalis]|eukprot:XP_018671326.2 coiled-coil and C2 domain-containing protein 2A isoform X3 [Ciona intestinalis]
MDGSTIKERLRARRRAMNLTAASEASSDTLGPTSPVSPMDTVGPLDTVDMIDPLDDTGSDDGSALKSILESRREASRRKLATQEQVVAMEMEELDKTLEELPESPPTTAPTPSHGGQDTASSPRTDSRSGTPHGRSTPSLHSTLRSRLQAKMLKKGGGTTDERRPRSRRLKDRMNLSTRFDETIKQYSTLEEAQLLEKIESKLSWKKAVQKTREKTGEASEVDSYDFFTKQYEDVLDVEEETEGVKDEGGGGVGEGRQVEGTAEVEVTEQSGEVVQESATASEGGQDSGGTAGETPQPDTEVIVESENTKLLVSDIVPKELDWKLYLMHSAEYNGYNQQVEKEKVNYFIPSSLPPEAASKVEEDAQPRYLEDEGFYVGEKPIVLQQNTNILENRLIKHGGRGWFGSDGQVDSLPNPVAEMATKPWVDSLDELDPCVETVYVKAQPRAVEDKYLQVSDENELQIDIGSINFIHHSLMSREHVLASNITMMYDEYRMIRHKNYITFYTDKLAALRNAVETLKETLGVDPTALQKSRINDFTAEIRRTTQQLSTAESSERDMMRQIINEWEAIKSLREEQGYNNTSVRLVVKKEEVNYQHDLNNWETEVAHQVDERRAEYDVIILSAHQEEMRKYQVQLQEWKQNRLKMKRIRKRMQRGSKENLLDPSSEVEDDDINIGGNIDKPQKPDKPPPFDDVTVKNEVMNDLIVNRRNPGEARISLELTHTTTITPTPSVPPSEANRRRAMQKTSSNLRVLFNGREVFQTEPKILSSDFKLNFGSIFRVRIAQWPESLKVELLTSGLVSKSITSTFYLDIPPTTVHSGNVRLGVSGFTSNKVESHTHEGVGSGTPFTLRTNETNPTSLNTKGQLISSVSWSLDANGRVLAPKGLVEREDPISGANPLKSNDPVIAIGAERLQDPESLTKWVQESRLDPNDPENAALVPFMQGNKDGDVFLTQDYFRLEQLQEEFNFITEEEFSRLNRFRLLRLRHEEIPEFRNISMLPCNEHEVTESAFTAYERRLKEKDVVKMERGVDGGTLSPHRIEVLKFRQNVKDAVLHRFYTSRHHYSLQDMVHEEQVPDIGTLGASIVKIAEPRRPLKPVRKTRKKAMSQNLTEGSVRILVNVVRGYNIPTRQASHSHQPDRRGEVQVGGAMAASSLRVGQHLDPSSKSYLVAPFVAASFQDATVTTSVAQGPSPSWNEELQLPFCAPNSDYNASNLQKVDDVLFIHLFDRVTEDATPTNTEDTATIITRVQNHWLGSYELPFSTIYQRGKIDGTFKIKVPPVLLGYNLERELPPNADMHERIESQFLQQSSGTYLTIFVTLEPVLKPMDPPKLKFESQEDVSLLRRCVTYLADCNKRYPNRNVKTTVIDIKGESVLITRFVRPLPPPPELTEATNTNTIITLEKIARFVSLIPFVSDNVTYAGICDLWSTCDQFMQMLCGDEEEHAILLLNYFLHLGKQAYLLLGTAVPEGNTAYVLTVDHNAREYIIWNASTGEYHDKSDPHSPLQSVGALINDTNIWFNVQTQDTPMRVRYNVTRMSDWKAFFPITATPLPSIQPESLYYPPTDQSYVANLIDAVERTLKDRIVSWRPRHITRWNRSGNSILRQIVKGLEERVSRKTGVVNTGHNEQLLSQLGDVRFTGYPMDQPYTGVEAVVSAVRSTEVHKIQDPDVEFSMAVHIHAYPASVLAVWVYVAAIVNRRRHDL